MYNHILDTFIAVADCGSFTKAARRLYISPTAVMKQINTLEEHLDMKLVERTPSGIRLTAAGSVIYQNSRFIIDYSQKTITNAKAALHAKDKTFFIGTSLLNPAKPFIDLWPHVNKYFSEYKLHLVTFEDNHKGILSEIEQLGKKFDFLIGVCDSKEWLRHCNFLELGRYKNGFGDQRTSSCCQKCINIEDLYNETIMMTERGDSGILDSLRDDLEKIILR